MSFVSVFFTLIVIYAIIVVVSEGYGNHFYKNVSFVGVIFWIIIFSLTWSLIFGSYNRKKHSHHYKHNEINVSSTSSSTFDFFSGIKVDPLEICSQEAYQTQLSLEKTCNTKGAILRISFDGNESASDDGVVYTAVPEGYSQVFNINLPPRVEKEDLEVNSLLSWSSINGTTVEVNTVSGFKDVLVTIKTVQGITFLGKVIYSVTVGGNLTNNRSSFNRKDGHYRY